jgi:hypothetical protein
MSPEVPYTSALSARSLDAEEDVRRSAWTTLRSYSNAAFSITLRTHPRHLYSLRASLSDRGTGEPRVGAACCSRPRAWSYLVPERIAYVKEVGIFNAVRRHKVIDRGTQLGSYAVEGVSRLYNVGPALTVG